VRATTTCVVYRDHEVQVRGVADLQSGPFGWRAIVFSTDDLPTEGLAEGCYRLAIPSGDYAVRFDSVRLATREVRMRGIGDPPTEIAQPSNRPQTRYTPSR